MKKAITLDMLREEYPFESHWVPMGNLRMHYIDEGKGPVLLLLHACPMWSFEFRNLIRDLSKEYRVIAPDSIGFGLSDKPANYDYRMDSQVACLERMLYQLSVTDFSILMHGWGATIGSSYIVRHPDQVRNIIIMNSMAFSGYKLPLRLRLFRMFPRLAERVLVDLNLMFNGIRHLPENVRNGYMFPFQSHRDKVAILRFISQMPCIPEDESFESMIEVEHGLWIFRKHPVCIIWGDRDWLYPKKYLNFWMKLCPDSEVFHIPQAGRYIFDEAYDAVFKSVSTFLGRHGK